MKIVYKIIAIGLILMMGMTIKRTIEKEYPEIYDQYLKERAAMPWYKRMCYMK